MTRPVKHVPIAQNQSVRRCADQRGTAMRTPTRTTIKNARVKQDGKEITVTFLTATARQCQNHVLAVTEAHAMPVRKDVSAKMGMLVTNVRLTVPLDVVELDVGVRITVSVRRRLNPQRMSASVPSGSMAFHVNISVTTVKTNRILIVAVAMVGGAVVKEHVNVKMVGMVSGALMPTAVKIRLKRPVWFVVLACLLHTMVPASACLAHQERLEVASAMIPACVMTAQKVPTRRSEEWRSVCGAWQENFPTKKECIIAMTAPVEKPAAPTHIAVPHVRQELLQQLTFEKVACRVELAHTTTKANNKPASHAHQEHTITNQCICLKVTQLHT